MNLLQKPKMSISEEFYLGPGLISSRSIADNAKLPKDLLC